MKILPVGAELFYAEGRTDGHSDGQTDMTKLIVVFCKSANVPTNLVKVAIGLLRLEVTVSCEDREERRKEGMKGRRRERRKRGM
jgi:hypothetical protein